MKKASIILGVVAALFFTTQVFAAAGAVYVAGAEVNHIHQTDDITFIKLAGVHDNPAGCTSIFWYAIPTYVPKHDDFVRTALTALASNKVLSVYLDPTQCWFNSPVIVGLTINRL